MQEKKYRVSSFSSSGERGKKRERMKSHRTKGAYHRTK